MDGAIVFISNLSGDQIVLVKRRDVPVWVLPGGGIESDESPETAAVREVNEETGFDVSIIRKVAEYKYKNEPRKNHVFEARIVTGQARTSNESKAVEFFSIKDLPELTHPFVLDCLPDLQRKSKRVIEREIEPVKLSQVLGQVFRHPIVVFRYLLYKFGFPINT